jgi:hypothetical protein
MFTLSEDQSGQLQPLVITHPEYGLALGANTDEIILGNRHTVLAKRELKHFTITRLYRINGTADFADFAVAGKAFAHHILLSSSIQRIQIWNLSVSFS